MNKEELVELITKELNDPCLKVHTINKEEQGDYVRFWLMCDDKIMDERKFLIGDTKQTDISNWQAFCMMQHRFEKGPEAIAEAIISSVPHVQAEASPFADHLHGDLRHVLRKWECDTHANVPDNILATFLVETLKSINVLTRRRDSFFGFDPFHPTLTKSPEVKVGDIEILSPEEIRKIEE